MKEVVYSKRNFLLVKVSNGFLIINTKKEFKKGHSHINSYRRGRDAILFAINKTIPRRPDVYFLTTLQRISTDKNYIIELEIMKRDIKSNNIINKGWKPLFYFEKNVA